MSNLPYYDGKKLKHLYNPTRKYQKNYGELRKIIIFKEKVSKPLKM